MWSTHTYVKFTVDQLLRQFSVQGCFPTISIIRITHSLQIVPVGSNFWLIKEPPH